MKTHALQNPESYVSDPKVINTGKKVKLLDKYVPENSVYFSNKKRELLASPPFASLLFSGMKNLAQQADESLRFAESLGINDAVVVGAIPFDTQKQSCLRVSTNVIQGERPEYQEQKSAMKNVEIEEVPSALEYRSAVADVLQRFARGELDKVVLSRSLKISCEKVPNVKCFVQNLAARNVNGFTFAVNIPDQADNYTGACRRTLIGASPELLVSRRGNKVYANPLAGSEARQADEFKDREVADCLLHSEKDLREHAMVVRAIMEALAPLCKNIKVPVKPSLIHTATMWHLSTEIEAELIDPSTSSLELALAMHPTPAVCGYPAEAAKKVIEELEPYERNLFTGIVGWCNASGDGEWVVTIRCAEVDENQIQIFAGAGIVEGSCPDKETSETAAKFSTMLQALGL